MTVYVTATLILRNGLFPAAGIGVTVCNVCWGSAAREKPDVDVRACPFGYDDATSDVVEVCAVRLRVLILDATSGIGALTGRIDVAIGITERTCEATVVGDGTIIGSV